jgi:hypothetical protein
VNAGGLGIAVPDPAPDLRVFGEAQEILVKTESAIPSRRAKPRVGKGNAPGANYNVTFFDDEPRFV